MLLMSRTVLRIFVLVTGTTALLADYVSDVEEIRRKSQEYLSGPAYERIEKLPNDSASVIDMYATFGRLFLNGQLGACERKPYPSAACVIRVDGGRDAKLATEAATLLSEVGRLKDESPFNRSLPNPTDNYDAGLIIKQEQEIFKQTWGYYAYLADAVGEALNASTSLVTDLERRCSILGRWVAKVDRKWATDRVPSADWAINVLLHDVAPDCEIAYVDYARLLYDIYASRHDFGGGDSNKCLENFVIRYNNYDEKAYEAFVFELHKYLFQDLTLYGMCAAFSDLSDDERELRKTWVKEKLTTVSSQLLKAREVLEETPPTTPVPSTKAPWAEITLPPYTEWWQRRQSQEDMPTSEDVHSIVTNVMKSNGSDITQLPGKDRPRRYQRLIENAVHAVKEKYSEFAATGSVEGVMYLPYGESDEDLFCTLYWPVNTTFVAKKQNYMGASYLIKWTENPTPQEVLRSRIAFARDRSNDGVTWNTIFNSYHEDMCEQVRLMMGGTTLTQNGTYLGQKSSKESSGFTAVIAVRCTNEFVWYEPGWRYYSAAVTTASDYVISRDDGEYSNSCGQLIFLP